MKKQTGKTLDQFGLEGDGIIENFFHLLWTKDPMFGTIPSVYVPNTVIIRYNEPIAWYFMKGGALKKKVKKNLTTENIKEVFLRHISPSGIVAVFMRYKFEESNEEPDVVFEYYNEKEFLNFINNKWQVNNGILQQFIQPKGDKNYIIKANWSPKLCFFEKVEALTRINDPKYDIYDKVLTFEAEKYHSREGPLRGYVLPNKIQRICANIAQHVQNVSFESLLIARMILHFKVDQNSRIWLLLCVSLRINKGTEENKRKKLKVHGEEVEMNYKPEDYLSKIKTPEHIKTNIIKGKPVNMHKVFECVNCGVRLEPDSVFETNYKTIIEGYEWDHLREEDRHKANVVKKANSNQREPVLEKFEGGFMDIDDNKLDDEKVTSLVPPLIKKIYPRLKDETYVILRDDLSFLKKTANFCEECVLHIQQSQENHLKAQKQSKKDFYGTGRLKPEAIKFRYVHTLENIKQKKERSNTMTNLGKIPQELPGSIADPPTSSRHARYKSQSDLPMIFGSLAAKKMRKQSSLKNSSFDTSRDSDDDERSHTNTYRGGDTGRKISNPDSLPPPIGKPRAMKELNLNPNKESRLLTSLTTSRRGLLVEDITKKENLYATNAFFSTKEEQSQPVSVREIKKQTGSLTARDGMPDLAKTLTNYMPKMKFLQGEYQSLKAQSNINSVRNSDIVEKIFEGGDKGPNRPLFQPFRRKKTFNGTETLPKF